MATATTRPRGAKLRRLLSNSLSTGQLYLLLGALLVLLSAQLFYDSLLMQTEHVLLWAQPDMLSATAKRTAWSAPLDDVFIHFDFARSTALGYPFEWVPKNGYSSGGTSILYPFVLAIGHWLGFVGLPLMKWAAVVACVCVYAYLIFSYRFFRQLPAWSALLLPIFALSVGALNWTLFSGMEVALFLAIWAYCARLWDERLDEIQLRADQPVDSTRVPKQKRDLRSRDLHLGIACAFLVAGRPEAAPLVALFGIWIFISQLKHHSLGRALFSLIAIGAPGALVVIGHMVANKVLTGDSAAAGALAKLEMHHPYLNAKQVWNAWLFFMRYQFMRLSNYHFSSIWGLGFLLWPLALLGLFFQKTRRVAAMLWVSMLIWTALVALNGQVRWQNERYAMPTVAWLLLTAALGTAAGLEAALNQRKRLPRLSYALLLCGSFCAFLIGQSWRYTEQVWFFGRASRNILEQHVRAGLYLGSQRPLPQRLLLSDAGALPYMSRLPAFDLIGLGGYQGLPIAKASRQGVGGAIELLEYLPESERPDVMATYPSWWGKFVLFFGRPVRDFTVRGNVICGGASKVIYEVDWTPLENSGTPFSLKNDQRLVDTLDLADLLNEKAHQFEMTGGSYGYLDMRILEDPRDPSRGLWDSGRLFAPGEGFQAKARGFAGKRAEMRLRTVVASPAQFSILVNGKEVAVVDAEAKDAWQEIVVELPEIHEEAEVALKMKQGSLRFFHVFFSESLQGQELRN